MSAKIDNIAATTSGQTGGAIPHIQGMRPSKKTISKIAVTSPNLRSSMEVRFGFFLVIVARSLPNYPVLVQLKLIHPTFVAGDLRLIWLVQQKIFDNEVVHLRAHKASI